MSTDRRIDAEEVVHICNEILLNHKKQWNCAICRDMDRPRDCHIEWSMSEREKWILYNIAYIWNLEKCYRWTYLQSKNRDTGIENGCMDTRGPKSSGINWDIEPDISALLCKK